MTTPWLQGRSGRRCWRSAFPLVAVLGLTLIPWRAPVAHAADPADPAAQFRLDTEIDQIPQPIRELVEMGIEELPREEQTDVEASLATLPANAPLPTVLATLEEEGAVPAGLTAIVEAAPVAAP
jgi:hypothetical protein